MIKMKYVNPEEARLMTLYEYCESKKRGHSIGYHGYIEWVDKFGTAFRDWASTIPEKCIECGLGCGKNGNECINPFNPIRLHRLGKDTTAFINSL